MCLLLHGLFNAVWTMVNFYLFIYIFAYLFYTIPSTETYPIGYILIRTYSVGFMYVFAFLFYTIPSIGTYPFGYLTDRYRSSHSY